MRLKALFHCPGLGPLGCRGRLLLFCLLLLSATTLEAQPLRDWQELRGKAGTLSGELPAGALSDSGEWDRVLVSDVRGGRVHVLRARVDTSTFKHPAIFFPKNVFSFRVFAGGKQIYQHADESQFLPGRFTGWLWHLVDLPPGQGSDIVLQLYGAMPLRMVTPVLGERADLLEQSVSGSLSSFAVVIISAALGFVFLFLFIRGPGLFYGTLAVLYLCLSWWLFNVNFLSGLVLPGAPWRLQTEYFALYLAPAAACLFVHQAINSRIATLVRGYAFLLGAYAVGALLLDITGVLALYRTLLPFDALTLVGVILFLVLVIRGIATGQTEAKVLGIGVLGLLLFALNDVFVVLGLFGIASMRMHWGTLAFVLSVAGVAVLRIGRMHREIALMKDRLEDLVEERTRDLDQTLSELQRKDEIIQHELEIASGIQAQMLLELPVTSGRLQLNGFYRAMHEVSGDFYDLATTQKGATAFLMADVSGHGVPAALIMTMVKAIFHESALLFESPGTILMHLNNRLENHLSGTTHYATASVLVVDADGRAAFSNGGHRPAVYLPAEKQERAAWLDTEGTILGSFPAVDGDYAVRHFQLRPGDRVLFYTDGIVELRSRGRQQFGLKRLLRFFLLSRSDTPELLSRKLQAEIENHAQGSPPDDDMTFVCLTWN